MRLTKEQLEAYNRDGYLRMPGVFCPAEVSTMIEHFVPLADECCEQNYREKDSDVVRSAQALHLRDAYFAQLLRDHRILEPAQQLLGDEPFYAQQVKVNVKEAFTGEQWQWHNDFAHHHHADGVPEPKALNVHVFLDDVNEFNGPLVFIPGSHRAEPPEAHLDTTTTSYPLWVTGQDAIKSLAEGRGLRSQVGPAGTVVLFGDLMMHYSPANQSPWSRRIFSVIFNPVTNAQTAFARADHQHHRDFTPIEAVPSP